MVTYKTNELFSTAEIAKEVQKILFEEDRKFVSTQVEKIKNKLEIRAEEE